MAEDDWRHCVRDAGKLSRCRVLWERWWTGEEGRVWGMRSA